MMNKLSNLHTQEGIFDPLGDSRDGHLLTRAIIDTIQEPLVILDEKMRVIAASRSFYKKFGVDSKNTQDCVFYKLGNGQWNIPELKNLLIKVIPDRASIERYRLERDFPFPLGRRTMLINAREVNYKNSGKKMLLTIFDITDQERLESEKGELLMQKDLLLKEMRHRIANSLQLIASILILKAGSVKSEETRFHLEDAHSRIMSIATVQEQLNPLALDGGTVGVGTYLTALCESLRKSMIGDRKPILLEVSVGKGDVTSEEAVSFGLITTELVINALKHAFLDGRKGKVIVSYIARAHRAGRGRWILSVADNGVGLSSKKEDRSPGLGTGIVSALAHQLHAKIETKNLRPGTKVSVIHAAQKS